MSQLGFVILLTRDVAGRMAFYERAFGMQKKYLPEKEVFGEMDGEVPLQFVAAAGLIVLRHLGLLTVLLAPLYAWLRP